MCTCTYMCTFICMCEEGGGCVRVVVVVLIVVCGVVCVSAKNNDGWMDKNRFKEKKGERERGREISLIHPFINNTTTTHTHTHTHISLSSIYLYLSIESRSSAHQIQFPKRVLGYIYRPLKHQIYNRKIER